MQDNTGKPQERNDGGKTDEREKLKVAGPSGQDAHRDQGQTRPLESGKPTTQIDKPQIQGVSRGPDSGVGQGGKREVEEKPKL